MLVCAISLMYADLTFLLFCRPQLTDDPSTFLVYKFFPASKSTYEYVAECSNRGLCDYDVGVCTCFSGYTGDACQEQSLISC